MAQRGPRGHVPVRAAPSRVPKENKSPADEGNAKFWNSSWFSDLLIKFSGREIKAHRLIICQSSVYFDKLCGPESPFAEANQSEIELQGDDPDALEAMLRHLYGIRFTPPSPSLQADDKIRYYCNVVVVADKYGPYTLAQEARSSLTTFFTSIEDAVLMLEALVILTDEYPDCELLEQCARTLAKPRLKELASLPDFSVWLTKQHLVIQDLVNDATEFRSKFESLRPMEAWQCAFCNHIIVVRVQPKCCRNPCASVGTVYVNHVVHGPGGPARPSTHPTRGPQ